MSCRLLIAGDDDAVTQRAATLAEESEALELVDAVDDVNELHRALTRFQIDAVVLHDRVGGVPALDVARGLGADVGVVLLAATPTPELLRRAMQAGVRDVIGLPITLEQLEGGALVAADGAAAVRGPALADQAAPGDSLGRLIAFAGAKGGVGTTTVALQVALAALRERRAYSVCLVDFDLQTGDLHSLLDVSPKRSVADLVDVAADLSPRHLSEALFPHPTGLRLLLAPDSGELAERVTGDVARSVVAALRGRHALTIVDCGAHVTEAGAVAAELADHAVIVTTPDVLALRGVRRMADLWQRLDVRADDHLVVLNRAARKLEVQADMVRKLTGARLAATQVPAAFRSLEPTVNAGNPHELDNGRLLDAYEDLADELGALPEPAAENGSRGVLSRLLAGERGAAIPLEFGGLLPLIVLAIVAVWQMCLIGLTFILAEHAAREGAREVAVGSSSWRSQVENSLPGAWAEGLRASNEGGAVKVTVQTPMLLPGVLDLGVPISATAGTVRESRRGGPADAGGGPG
ncbi:MAG TPA: AAA family ATPase [Thermoleophilaceae bacterium]|jgi:pilus assembly protein CpaE